LKKNALFIINPIAGGKSKLEFPKLAETFLNKDLLHATYRFTERPGHAFELAAAAEEFDIIIAVGGDGTINEIASALEGTDKIMGIIPCGSGNGLARSLKLPLKHGQAVARLNRLHTTRIDSGAFNDRKFFNMAGIGFDAHISKRFAEDVTRGLRGYVRTTFNEISRYRSQLYRIESDGQVYEREAFMISIANSSQFGNNAHVSPFASVSDGLLDVCIIKPFPLYHFPVMGYHMFSKTAHKSNFVEIIKVKDMKLILKTEGANH